VLDILLMCLRFLLYCHPARQPGARERVWGVPRGLPPVCYLLLCWTVHGPREGGEESFSGGSAHGRVWWACREGAGGACAVEGHRTGGSLFVGLFRGPRNINKGHPRRREGWEEGVKNRGGLYAGGNGGGRERGGGGGWRKAAPRGPIVALAGG